MSDSLVIEYVGPPEVMAVPASEGSVAFRFTRHVRMRGVPSIAQLWAFVDEFAPERDSVDDLGIDMCWPEPGSYAAPMVAAQLYWPRLGP